MLYMVRIAVEAYHKPTKRWDIATAEQGVRAVSRKAALDKGLRVGRTWNAYIDHRDNPEWVLSVEARLIEGPA